MEKARVQKFIAQSGYCSRRKAEELIIEGKVKVRGITVRIGDQCLEEDIISIDGVPLPEKEEFVYIVMNKKKGRICTKEKGREKGKTVFEDLNNEDNLNGLFTIGRLDKDTTGLLLLTNDGSFAQQIIHPSRSIEKEYEVHLDKELAEEDKKSIEKGLILDSYQLKSCQIKKLNGKNQYSIIIQEGRKRQIRRVFEKKGYIVEELKRIRLGGLKLDEKKISEASYLRKEKEELLKFILSNVKTL